MMNIIIIFYGAPKGMLKLMGHFASLDEFLRCSFLFGVRWKFHLHTQHVKEIIFLMKLKLFPFICGFMYDLQPLPAHSFAFVFPSALRPAKHAKKHWMNFYFYAFIKRSRIIKKCFFSGPNESDEKRISSPTGFSRSRSVLLSPLLKIPSSPWEMFFFSYVRMAKNDSESESRKKKNVTSARRFV